MAGRGSGRLVRERLLTSCAYNQSMEMDGTCAVNRCMIDGKLENVAVFLKFLLASVGPLPAGDMYNFLKPVVSIIICQ